MRTLIAATLVPLVAASLNGPAAVTTARGLLPPHVHHARPELRPGNCWACHV